MIFKILYLWLIVVYGLFGRDIPSDNKIQGRLNIVNGKSAECIMHQFYTQSGWEKIEGEIGRNGIDGLYYKKKKGIITEVLVSESKWNTSRLGRSGKNKTIKQMSKEWVLITMNKLVKRMNTTTYRTLTNMIHNDHYRARLFRVKPSTGNRIVISIYKIKNKGLNFFNEIKERELKPIIMGKPDNNFQVNMLNAYNRCREESLHKYLGFLTQDEIVLLLQDNYIQKSDIKALYP